MASLNSHIFRAYDIRGKAGSDLTPEVYRLIGQGFGSVLREMYTLEHPKVAVGRDMRTHSKGFSDALIEGLISTGCTVLDIGMTPSPVNYFVINHEQLDGGLQVTASHNPPEDNGLKLQIREAVAFSGEDIQVLLRRIQAGTFLQGTGSVQAFDALTPYLAWLSGTFGRCAEGLTVALDAGNGTSGHVAADAFRAAGAEVIGLYLDPDGTFPNHPADPSKHATLKELQASIVREKASIGIAFDGDGDRLGVIDENGVIRSCDEILLLLAQDYLQRYPGTPVVFTVSMSSTLETEIKKWGGKPVMVVVGHSFVEHAMREHGAKLGGEQSGHFFLEDLARGYDDALIVALQVLKILHASGQPFSALFRNFPKVYLAKERRPHCPDDRKFPIVADVVAHFKAQYPVIDIDGARIDFGEGAWANIRASNTSPKLSICMEARSPEKLAAIEKEVLDYLKRFEEIEWDD